MALVIKDRVKEQTTTTGTGSVTLTGAVAGFESFSAVGDGNTTYYAIVHQSLSEWEVGLGTYTASGTTLSRDTVLDSSNSGSAVNFSAGVKDVFVTYAADKAVYRDASGDVSVTFATSATNATTAVSATNATTAVSATNATTAVSATNATSATFATSATNATTAITATSATNATSATFATSATNATTAITATSATNATNAVSATFAASATNATTAVSATNATSATFATNATNLDGGTVSATSGTFNTLIASGLTYPSTDGTASQIIQTNGSGTLSFVSVSGGATDIDGLSDAITNSSGQTIGLGTGALANDDGTTNRNTALGYNALNAATAGFDNTAVGHNAADAITTGDYNVAIGKDALTALTTGNNNTAVGIGANSSQTTSSFNTGIGQYANILNTTGTNNTAVGASSNYLNTSSSDNTAVGKNANYGKTGEKNTAVGSETLVGSGTGAENTAIGQASLFSSTNGNKNTAVGTKSAQILTTGSDNVFIGYSAGDATTTGTNQIVIGYDSDASSATVSNEITLGNTSITKFRIPGIDFVLKDNGGTPTTGQVLTADGSGEGYWATPAGGGATDIDGLSDAITNSSGQTIGLGTGALANDDGTTNRNTALGYNALNAVTSGQYNIGIGYGAGDSITTGNNNSIVGYSAGGTMTTGADNTLFGYFTGFGITNGLRNTLIGYESGYSISTADDIVAVGYNAGRNSGGESVWVGSGSGDAGTGGTSSSVGIGKNSLTKATSYGNTAVGADAGEEITTGQNNTLIGRDVGAFGTYLTTGTNNTIIGFSAAPSSSTVSNEITLGNTSITKFRIPGIDFVLKDNGGTPTTGQVLTADASGEGYWATPSAGATDINGLSDAVTNSSGATIGLGTGALANDDGTTNRNTALGYNALNLVTTGDNNVAVGYRAGDTLTTNGKNVFVGYFAGRTATGEENTFIGYTAGENNTDSENTFIGYSAGQGASPGTSAQCVGIGKNALKALTTGDGNVAVGFNSGDAITTGYDNTYIGESSGTVATTSYFNTAVGSLSASALTTGISNTLLGTSAGNTLTTGSNNTIIGNSAASSSASVSNEITLGNTSITKFRIPGIDFVLKDNGGTPTTGQVLTADGSGEGYWATPAGFSYSVITSGTALSSGTYIDISGYKWIKAWFIADSAVSTDHGPKLSTSGASNTGVSVTHGQYFRQSPTGSLPNYGSATGSYSPSTSSLYYGPNSGAADNKRWTIELWGLDQTNVSIETSANFISTFGLMQNFWWGKTTSGSSTWFLYVDNDLDSYLVIGGS